MGKRKIEDFDYNLVVFHKEEDYHLRFGIKSEDDLMTYDKKYPVSFMFHVIRKNEIPGTYIEKLARAIKEDIEKSPAKFGKVDVVIKLFGGALWCLEALVMAGDDKEYKRLKPAIEQERFTRTNEVLASVPE